MADLHLHIFGVRCKTPQIHGEQCVADIALAYSKPPVGDATSYHPFSGHWVSFHHLTIQVGCSMWASASSGSSRFRRRFAQPSRAPVSGRPVNLGKWARKEVGPVMWISLFWEYFWVNYNELTTSELEIIVRIRGIIPFYGPTIHLNSGEWNIISFTQIWVCLKMGYTPNEIAI